MYPQTGPIFEESKPYDNEHENEHTSYYDPEHILPCSISENADCAGQDHDRTSYNGKIVHEFRGHLHQDHVQDGEAESHEETEHNCVQ